jgi:peroxiredoxin
MVAWGTSPEVRAARAKMRVSGLKVSADGSYRAEDVFPGTYVLTFSVNDGGGQNRSAGDRTTISAMASYDVVVADIPGGQTDEPLDLGPTELKVTVTRHRSLEIGRDAPLFEAKTLDGKPLKLADLRGKFVLLDFWATWCVPCSKEQPNLIAAHNAFGSNTKFVLIGLSLDKEAETVRSFIQAQKLPWAQVHLGEWSESDVPTAYGVEGIPSIWLIGPDGKVVAKDLRGDEIKEAVAKALGQP